MPECSAVRDCGECDEDKGKLVWYTPGTLFVCDDLLMVPAFEAEQADHVKEQSTPGQGGCKKRPLLLNVSNEGKGQGAN